MALVFDCGDGGVFGEGLAVFIMEFDLEVGKKEFDFFAAGEEARFFGGDCGVDELVFDDGFGGEVGGFEVEFFEFAEEFLILRVFCCEFVGKMLKKAICCVKFVAPSSSYQTIRLLRSRLLSLHLIFF